MNLIIIIILIVLHFGAIFTAFLIFPNAKYDVLVKLILGISPIITIIYHLQKHSLEKLNNRLLESDRISERFDRASSKLKSESETERLSGIYSLNEIAVHSTKNNLLNYQQMVHNLLCTHIRLMTNKKEYLDTYINNTSSSVGMRTSPEIQTIINLMFKNNDIYNSLPAKLNESNLQRADFRDCSLVRADFYDCHLEGSNFSRAKLDGALLVGAHLEGADLSDISMKAANIDKVKLENTCLENANLSITRLVNANLSGAIFNNAILQGADLSGSKLTHASFENADIRALQYRPTSELNSSLHSSSVSTYVDKQALKNKITKSLTKPCKFDDLPKEIKDNFSNKVNLQIDQESQNKLIELIDRIW